MTDKSYRTRITVVGLLLALCLLAMAVTSRAAPATDFTLKDYIHGQDYTLSQFRGKVVIIIFFTFFSKYSREEMADLNKIYHEYQGKGLQTLGITLPGENPAQYPAQIRFLVKELGLDYPVLIGNDKVSEAYGSVQKVPTTFIIDKAGNVAHKVEGSRRKETFEKMIKPLL